MKFGNTVLYDIFCLQPLFELKHLNLAYNNLQRAPELSLNARTRLVTLVLRHNQLESINGECTGKALK